MDEILRLKFNGNPDTSKLPLEKIQNTVMCGDCNDWLDRIPNESLDMIYIDPPFFTRTDYEVIWGNGWEKAAWEDWKNVTKGDIDAFITYMQFRITKMRDKLKSSGTFWLHCDYRANYKFRLMLEEVFGGNFVGELIIETSGSGIDQCKTFARKHETLFVFSKTKKFYLNNLYTDEKKPSCYNCTDDARGIYTSDNLSQQGIGPSKFFNGKKLDPPKGRHWIWDQKTIDLAIANEKNKDPDITKKFIFFSKTGTPRIKRFWNGSKERHLPTLWKNFLRTNWTDNDTNYPTKKPIALLKRIIECGSPEKGIIGDFFAGGGTTLLAAAQLNRNYMGCDVSPIAIKAQNRRFIEANLTTPQVLGFPKSKKTYLEFNKQGKNEFEIFLCGLCGWNWLDDKSGQGKGFDAFIGKIGIQIKNWEKSAGVNEIRTVAGALNSSSKFESALLVAWDLSAPAHTELQKLKNKGVKIDFKKIDYFLDCFLITENKEKEIGDLLFTATSLQKSA